MNERGLVEVPENAVRDEPIAFGLTAIQLGICALAVVVAAILNVLPIWEPIRLALVVLGAGPIALAAALPVRGEPAYRWIVRGVRYRRDSRCWNATLKTPDKSQLSGLDDTAGAEVYPPMTESTVPKTVEEREAPPATPAAPSPRARLRLVGSERPDLESDPPPPVPHLLGRLHVVCLLSFAGGVGKTTLAVETASYIAAHARYRTPEGETLGVSVLLIDAARLAAAAGLRLGLDPDGLSKAWTYRDWADPQAALDARVLSRHRVDVITLPPHPQLMGRERPVAEDVGDEFRAPEAEALLNAARGAAYQLVVVDLGGLLEDGHRVLLKEAAVIVGVVRPTLESLPDVLRLANHLREVGLGRKLVLVANQCEDDTELRRFAREADVPLIGAVPPSPAFVAAADRHELAWRADARLRDALLPIARTVWPLDSLATQPRANGSLAGLLRRALRRAGRHDR